MFYQIVLFVWQFVLDLVAVLGMTDDEKDLEIMLLRQQLRIVEGTWTADPALAKGAIGSVGSTVEGQSEQRARRVGGKRTVVQA